MVGQISEYYGFTNGIHPFYQVIYIVIINYCFAIHIKLIDIYSNHYHSMHEELAVTILVGTKDISSLAQGLAAYPRCLLSAGPYQWICVWCDDKGPLVAVVQLLTKNKRANL